jgi:hypothetical protein
MGKRVTGAEREKPAEGMKPYLARFSLRHITIGKPKVLHIIGNAGLPFVLSNFA